MSGMLWAAYERVSTEEQAEEGHSIQVQKEANEKFVETRGDKLFRHYAELGVSGGTTERPQFQALLADARAGKFQGVVVYKIDRLSRNLRDTLCIVEDLKSWGIALKSVDQTIDTSTPHGELLFQQLASFAEFERKLIRERTVQGLYKRAQLGKYTSAQVPYGYNYDPEAGKLRINEKEAEVVRKVFDGLVNDRLSMRQVTFRLIDSGVPTKNAGKRGRRTIWRTSTVWQLLTNTAYHGEVHYRKTRPASGQRSQRKLALGRRPSTRDARPEQEWIRMEVPALITKELFERAQERLRENQVFSPRNRVYDRPLRGMFYCGECGSKLEPVSFLYCGKRYWKYRCRGRAFRELGKDCRIPHVKAEPVEERVWGRLMDSLREPGVLLGWNAAEKALRGHGTASKAQDMEVRRSALARQLKRLDEAFRLGGYSPEEFAEEKKRLRASEEELLREERHSQALEGARGSSQAERETISEACDKLYNTAHGMNLAERWEFLRLLKTRVEVKADGRVRVSGEIPICRQTEGNQLSRLSFIRSAAGSTSPRRS